MADDRNDEQVADAMQDVKYAEAPYKDLSGGIFPRAKYLNTASTNFAARGLEQNELVYGGSTTDLNLNIKDLPASEYPLNQVRETITGHVTEIDDTPGRERMLFKHSTGAGIDMRPDGTIIINAKYNTIEITGNDQKIIVKVGSAVLTDEHGRVRKKILSNIAQDIAALKNRQIILVSSGAIAIGKRLLNIKNVELIEESQALAAVGQLELIKAWKAAFRAHSIDVGQVLLTPKEIQTAKDARNAIKTINQLHRFRVLPIVNENDTTATDEIQFGDNDLLAAKLAKIFKADLLIMLSAVEGLYESFNDQTNQSTLIRQVSKLTKDIHAMAGKASKSGKGGMTSKIEAAKIMLSMNSNMVITKGDAANPLLRLQKSVPSTWFNKS